MEEIERELGVCKIPSLESHPEYPESNAAVAQFSFSNVNGPNFWVSYYDDEIKSEDAEDFAEKERIRGDFQVGSITLFRSNPRAYINPGISEPDDIKTSFPTPVKIWCDGEVALRHSPKFPNRNIDEIMFSSVRFSLDHLIEWMADQVLDSEGKTRKDIHGMDSFVRPVEQVIDTQLVTATLRVSADRNLDDIFRNPITATSTILTEIILEFYQEDGISYSEATRWVCLFQSLLSIAYEAPSNLKYFYAETEDGYDVEIYPKLNIADDDIRCIKHGEVDEHLQDELWFFFGMFLDFKSLGPDGMRRFLENVAGKGHLDNNTLENLATLANQYFTNYPRGFGHVELFRCVERIASNADNLSQAIDEVSQKARDLFDEGDSSDNFNELNKWATKFRNNVAHGKQEPLPHDEADLTTYLKLILSCHLLSDYADKSIWKSRLSKLFWDIQHNAGTKQQD